MRAFCTDIAIDRGEPLAGTGAVAERHLFVCLPKSRWRRPRFEAEGFAPELTAAMRAASGSGKYVGLIASDDGDGLELRSFPDNRRVMARDQTHAAELISAWGQGEPLPGPSSSRPAILCCTDAKVDACCARYGFALFKALSSAAPAMDVDVFQCTHIGGCHFAPSVIVMPHRHRYGRLSPSDVPAFLNAIARDAIYLPNYRGNPSLSEAEQSAEVAVRQHRQADGQHDVVILGSEMDGDRAVVSLQVNGVLTQVGLRRQGFEVHGNCSDLDEPPKSVARWLPA